MEIDAIETIKSSVSAPEAFLRYGFKTNAKGFCLCPFHAEKTPSCKVFKDHFYCFGCGAHGDVIRFAQDLFGSTFPEALKRLDTDFHLGLFTVSPLTAKTRGRAVFERNKRLREMQAELDSADGAYWEAFDTVKRLRDIIDANRPKSIDEPPSPLFVQACDNLPYFENELEMADIHRKEVMRKWNELN